MPDPDKTSILLVDDLPEKLLVYRSILDELGQDLVPVTSGEQALRRVLETDFAVILLDVNMPTMNGFETAHLIRSRKRSAHVPIIFLTAFADEVQVAQGYATGAVDYVTTPVVPEILRAKVRVFVELFRMRQQAARHAEEQARRAAAEESARRSAFLAEASRALASSLDVETTLRALTRIAVPELAELGLVTLAEDGSVGRSVLAWFDPARRAAGPTYDDPFGLPPWLRQRINGVLSGGNQHVLSRLDPPEQLAISSAAGGQAVLVEGVLILPLLARGRTLGALTLASGPRQPPRPDVSLAVEVSARAGVALDNALLVRDVRENDTRKNEFLAMLAHELRNPLAPVRNALQVIDLCRIDHPTLDWARGVINRQVTHLVRLVDDLLDVSRITRGKIRLQMDAVDVASVVASAVETTRPLIETHRHELSLSLPSEPILVTGDPTRLAQVLANLLNNAAKYTPDGGRIALSVRRDRGEVVFCVKDSGAGIPREMLPRIFDLFTQADTSIDRSQGGLGIGLTLVRRLVEMHGGSVQASSEGPGLGSEFVVRLPALEAPPPATTSEACDGLSITHRILVVDDNADAAESLGELLRISGHEVRLVFGGPEALVAAQEFRPAVVLLDIGLPGLDGYEVARRLRADPLTAGCLLVAVSGYGQAQDRARSKEAGIDHHLTKPADFIVLQRILNAFRQGEKLAGTNGRRGVHPGTLTRSE